MRLQKVSTALLLVLTNILLVGPAAAATATTTFQVTANVNVACTIQATALDFTTYALVQLDVQSQIGLVCTNTAQWAIGLNAGTFPGATVTTRAMTGPPTFHLNYSLFADPAHSINWGNTVGTDTVSGVGTGAVEIVNVYGRIPAAQNVGPGGYADTITATITF